MLVFTDTEGNPLRKSNFTRRVWHRWLKSAELPRVKFHSLRHSHITALLADGGNLKAVAERVGHSQTSMTADVYAHALELTEGGEAVWEFRSPYRVRGRGDKIAGLYSLERVGADQTSWLGSKKKNTSQ